MQKFKIFCRYYTVLSMIDFAKFQLVPKIKILNSKKDLNYCFDYTGWYFYINYHFKM